MQAREFQEVTLIFPQEEKLKRNFDMDPRWELISVSTVAATYRKLLKEEELNVKETNL